MSKREKDNNAMAPGCSRRTFLIATGSTVLGGSLLGCATTGPLGGGGAMTGAEPRIKPAGPGSKYVAKLKVTFVRRQEDYGMSWPGAIYDGKAALANYRQQIETTAKQLGVAIDMREQPIYSEAEADAWVAQAKADKADGLLVVLLDRQMHAWPTAYKAVDSGIPTVLFSPVGAAFTTNTWKLADKRGFFACSTDDFSQVAYGMKMLKTGAKLREMRFVVIAGKDRRDDVVKHVGSKLRYVPAQDFLDEYQKMPMTDDIRRMASSYTRQATRRFGATDQDVLNGIKSYRVAQLLLEREDADGITMDCLGALGQTKVSLPCIAWSKMLDHGIPAACEADLGACVTHALVLYLFDRPGFQQDPVPETATGCIIGAHCSCPTRLNGIDAPPEPFYLSHHHGMRDAVPRTMWRVGQRMTVADFLPSEKDDVPPELVISAGTVVNNVAVPPAGGCVVSVTVDLDGDTDVLNYAGFHQLFFYGDYKKQLQEYCHLFKIKPLVV